jgi:NADH-ubiquinone oxidoreductase chain 1
MTEHSAAIFVFFFLAEYASIVLICIFTSILFLGGYLPLISFDSILNLMYYFGFDINMDETNINLITTSFEGLVGSLSLGLKTCFLIFAFI